MGLVSPTANAVDDHATVHYIRKVATCALAAGVGVESTFAGSASLSPPPLWAQSIVEAEKRRRRAEAEAPAPAPAATAAAAAAATRPK